MGSGASKEVSGPTTQTWTSDQPVRFSQGIVDNLQGNNESDSTRAKALELHIQSRVASELKRLQEQASKDFEALSAKLSSEDQKPPSSEKSAGDQLRQIGRESVEHEIGELKKKLEGRKKVKEVDEGVENAKGELVSCLRRNDRRPLDCWKEVEGFKEQVRRMEEGWVERVVR